MYNGTSGGAVDVAQVIEKVGAAYRIRTCDPIITNNRPLRQTAVFSPTSVTISPICAVFVSSAFRYGVHQYIGPMCSANRTPGLVTTRRNRAMSAFSDNTLTAPGEDDWLGWLDALNRRDTGTIDCVPAFMRPPLEGLVGEDGRLIDRRIVPGTPYGCAKFNMMGRPLPWTGSGLRPIDIQYLLDDGHGLDAVRDLCDSLRRGDGHEMIAIMPSEVPADEPPVKDPWPDTCFTDLYFIRSAAGPIEIGVSGNPEKRLKSLQTAHPYKLEIICVVAGGGRQEPEYHDRFAAWRLEGEWFSPAPEILATIATLSPLSCVEGRDHG